MFQKVINFPDSYRSSFVKRYIRSIRLALKVEPFFLFELAMLDE